MYKKLLLVFGVLLFYYCEGQKQNATHILQQVHHFILKSPSDAVQQYSKALEKAYDRRNNKEIYELHKYLGYTYYVLQKDSLSVEHFSKALRLSENYAQPNERAFILCYLGKLYSRRGDFSRAIDYFRKSYEESIQAKDTLQMFEALQMLLITYQSQAMFVDALSVGKEMMQLGLQADNRHQLLQVHFHFGQIYFLIDDNQKSLAHYQQAMNYARELADTYMISLIHVQLADLYRANKQYQRSLNHFLQSYDLYHKIGNIAGMLHSLRYIAEIYAERKQYQQALNYLFRARNLSISHGDNYTLFLINHSIAGIYMQLKNYPKALWYYDMNYTLAKNMKDPYLEVKSLYDLGIAQMHKGSLVKARDIFLRAYAVAHNHPVYDLLDSIATQLSIIYRSTKEYQLALEWLQKSKEYQYQSNKQQHRESFEKLQSVFEYSTFISDIKLLQKQHEIEKLEKEKLYLQKRNLVIVVILLLIVLFLLTVFIYVIRKRNQILKLRGLEIEASNLALMQLNIQLQKKQQELDETIMDLKKTNEALQESQKQMKLAQESKQKLYHIISHDLRAPMNVFTSFINQLKQNVKKMTKDKLMMMINDMEKHVWSMNDLLQNLLQWSYFESRDNVQMEFVEASSVVQKALCIYEAIIQQRKIDVTTEIDNVHVYANEQMLQSILRNLISNAIGSMSDGGQLKFLVRQEKGGVRFEVHDTGSGMPISVKQALEQMSFTELWSAKPQEIGFGLMICVEFLHKHNSRLHITNKEAGGTIVWFIIPQKTG